MSPSLLLSFFLLANAGVALPKVLFAEVAVMICDQLPLS